MPGQFIKESDWKLLSRELRPVALERLCQRILKEATEIAADDSQSFHQRYLAVYQLIEEQDREIAMGFNSNSRSRAEEQLTFWYSRHLLSDDELARFSPELANFVKSIVLGDPWNRP